MGLWNRLTGRNGSGGELDSVETEGEKSGADGKSRIGILKKLLSGLLRALRKDHRQLGEGHRRLARHQKDLAESLEGVNGQLQDLSTHFDKVGENLKTAVEHLEESQEELVTQLKEQVARLKKRIDRLQEDQARGREKMIEVAEALEQKQAELASRLDALFEIIQDVEAAPDGDLLEAVGSMVQDDNRLLSDVEELTDRCPEDCFAAEFASETARRLRGMRSERVSLLAANDVELIDTMEKFDPSLHQATGTIPRPEGESGQGRVERIGLLRRDEEDGKVIQRALVSVYEDAEIKVSST